MRSNLIESPIRMAVRYFELWVNTVFVLTRQRLYSGHSIFVPVIRISSARFKRFEMTEGNDQIIALWLN